MENNVRIQTRRQVRHPGHREDAPGDASVIMLWQNQDGAWKLTRVISYDQNRGLLVK